MYTEAPETVGSGFACRSSGRTASSQGTDSSGDPLTEARNQPLQSAPPDGRAPVTVRRTVTFVPGLSRAELGVTETFAGVPVAGFASKCSVLVVDDTLVRVTVVVERNVVARVTVESGLQDLGIQPAASQANFCWFDLPGGAEVEDDIAHPAVSTFFSNHVDARRLSSTPIPAASASVLGSKGSFTLSPADDQEYAAKWLTDAEVSFRTGGFMLAAGSQNLFNVFPDRNSTVNSFNGIQTFPSQSPFGMNGRTLYVRLARTF
jgi:hypothetical protein